MNWLDRKEMQEAFAKRPNPKIAHYYLQCLMRDRHMDKIDDETYLDGLEAIKTWMKERK